MRHLEGGPTIGVVAYAADRAEDELDWLPADIIGLLRMLQPEDFHRREPSTAGAGVVWTFEPLVDEDLVWLCIVEDGTSWRVISCHLSETTGEALRDDG